MVFTLYRVANGQVSFDPYLGVLEKDRLAMPPGMEATINPDKILVSQDSTYHSSLTLVTTMQLEAGEYYLFLYYTLDQAVGGRNIEIHVSPE